MTLILENYDLSLGETFSSVIDLPFNVNLGYKTNGVTDPNQVIALEWHVQVGSEDFHVIRSDKRQDIITKVRGNESDNANVFGINATKLKIKVIPPAGSDGTLNLWVIES